MSKETLKLALEALETSARNWPSDSIIEAIAAIKEALAQPEQEPVSFLDWYDNAHWGNEDFKDGCWRAWDAALAQRTWVGLTDDELYCMYNEPRSDADIIAFAREVEVKLKEKNYD